MTNTSKEIIQKIRDWITMERTFAEIIKSMPVDSDSWEDRYEGQLDLLTELETELEKIENGEDDNASASVQ